MGWKSSIAATATKASSGSAFPPTTSGPGIRGIKQFCKPNYGITFPAFAKTSVVGTKANPLFRDLAAKTGNPVAVFESAVTLEDQRITSQIEKLTAAR